VAISFVKKGFIENLKRTQFSVVGRTVRAPRADGPRAIEAYLISNIFGKVFREKSLPSGQSVGLRRTVRN
jgi:hypothetical protein